MKLDDDSFLYSTETNTEYQDYPSASTPSNPSFGYWMLVHLLLSIPMVNLIFTILWSTGIVSEGKECLINFARARLCWIVIQTVITVLLLILFIVSVKNFVGNMYY